MSLLLMLRIQSALASTSEHTPWFIKSPNGVYKAQVIGIGYDNVERAYDIVKIFKGGDEISEDQLTRNSSGMARAVYDAKWSPNSRFFVFLTKYCAGHSIWHSPTTIYDSKTNIYWELDDYIGAIVDEKVRFTGEDILKIQVINPKDGNTALPITKEISLSKFIKSESPH